MIPSLAVLDTKFQKNQEIKKWLIVLESSDNPYIQPNKLSKSGFKTQIKRISMKEIHIY